MDRLKQLEEKKRKLQELRDRRKHANNSISTTTPDDLVNHLLRTTNSGPVFETEMVSTTTQTEDLDEDLKPTPITHDEFPNPITYEKAIQTEAVEFKDEQEAPIDSIEDGDESSDSSTTSAEPDKSITGRKNGIVPYVMKDQALTLGTRSFSLLEALDKSRLSLTENELKNLQHFQTSHVLEPAASFAGDAKCVWIDHYSELVLSVVQYRDNNSLEGSINSVVTIFKFNTAEIIDSAEFREQALLRGEFIRKKGSKIVSVLLTSYNGKTILYEMRASPSQDGSLEIERNVISRNYHHFPAFAVWQYHTGEPRVLVGSTDGTISEIDVLRMELYYDRTSSERSSRFKVMPVPPSALVMQDEASQDIIRTDFRSQLERLSRYDEVSITSIVTMPQDPDVLYIGCEDGGIYKIKTQDLNDKTITIDINNNDFIPKMDSNLPWADAQPESSIFHSLPVTGLYNCRNAPNLLLSSSMDWDCIIWDVANAKRLTQIELEYPVINCEWISYESSYYIFVLTAAALSVFDPRILADYSSMDTVTWSASKTPVEIFSIPADHCEGYKYLTSFKVLEEKGRFFVILGGDLAQQQCFAISLRE